MNNESERKQVDDAKTAAEHEAIILRYQRTGELDRADAIKKYRDFNGTHPDYYVSMTAMSSAAGTSAPIGSLPDNVIVDNLQAQLAYLAGKKITEDRNNG